MADPGRVTYGAILGIGIVIVLALTPLLMPGIRLIGDSEGEISYEQYIGYVLIVTILVAGMIYALEQTSALRGLRSHIDKKAGQYLSSIAAMIAVVLDLVIWIALFSVDEIRTKVVIASIGFHVLWMSMFVYAWRFSGVPLPIGICAGFIGAAFAIAGGVVSMS